MTCPGELELTRAIADGAAPELAAHLAGCAACRRTWDATRAMIELARELPADPPSPAQREEVRTSVLAAGPRIARRPIRRAWRLPAVAASAAAAGVIAYLALAHAPPAPMPHARGLIHPRAGARYVAAAPTPDEVVRLSDGVIDLEVEPLAPGERFRVVVGGAEIEVRGTAFTVTARADHLTAVAVQRGRVEVRPEAGTPTLLGAGQSWTAAAAMTAAADPAAPTPEPAAASTRAAASIAPPSPDGSHVRASTPRSPDAPRITASTSRGPDAPRLTASSRVTTPRSSDVPRITEPAPRAAFAPTPSAEPAPGTRTAGEQSYDQAWEALRASNFTGAASGFARVLLLAPDSVLVEDAGFWRAVALARGKRGAEAISAFHDFLDSNPRAARAGEASAMLGWLLIDAHAYDEAARRFRAALGDASTAVRHSAIGGLDALARHAR